MNLNYNIEVSHIARSWYFENRRKIRKVYTRELKNNKKIEEQEPARTIDKHHSAIEVRKKKKNQQKTHTGFVWKPRKTTEKVPLDS